MNIRTGIDIVYLPRFKKTLQNGGEIFLKRIFNEREMTKQNIEHLAGIFAAKEAVIKALGLAKNSWLDIEIRHSKNGSPKVILKNGSTLQHSSLSISHDGKYVVSQFIALQ